MRHLLAFIIGIFACAAPFALLIGLFLLVGPLVVSAVAIVAGVGVLIYAVGRYVLDILAETRL